MKVKHFTSFAIICGILANFAPATAADMGLPASGCFATGKPGYDFIVYFEHSRPHNDSEANQSYQSITPTATQQCVNDMKQTLANLRPSSEDDCLILLASADYSGQDTNYDNNALSKRRLDMVEKMLTGIQSGDCVEKWYAGASNATVLEESPYYDSEQRAVRIIQTRKNAPKYEQIIHNLTQYISTSSSSISVIHITLNPASSSEQQILSRIHDLATDLAQIESKFKKSHWKTADGNFNGARLASDSIAGVVLGTAGGLITSNVIKKNQLRGGFEDIQCTIAGQVVANYDDEFTTNMNLNK
ncbi:MAG: hypothetical protein NC311_06200 [Muribaculaceae bacterium]|nr:hypothetical protein [Muribaculaceae bacterium]